MGYRWGRTGAGDKPADNEPSGVPAIGKQTLVEQIAAHPAATGSSVAGGTESATRGLPRLQLRGDPAQPPATSAAADIALPKGGINKTGFIDNGDGANIRTGPAESGGRKVRDQPLPPATRVFVSGTYPDASQWWYVTAYVEGSMLRGYVQDFRVTTELPEPTAKLHNIVGGDTAEKLAAKEYGSAVRDGHDLRYYENVLLYVNRQQGRAGITGSYQDPGILGGGSNNIQLVAGHRIWLVSPAYAKALEAVVPSGSLTGGAVAKVRRFVGHLEDILASVTRSPQYFGEVAGEYAQIIRDHLPEIIGIVAGFIMAEAVSAFLAATPTGVGQIAATIIQLGLAAFGAAGAMQAGAEAVKHASEWLTIAWTAKGKDERIVAASKEFLRMLVSIAMAALSALGAKANHGNALKIAGSMQIGGLPALAAVGGSQLSGAGAAAGVKLGGPGFAGPLGTAGGMKMENKEGGGADRDRSTADSTTELEQGGSKKTEHGKQRAEEAKVDTHRQVGDQNRLIREGRKFTDSETGHTVHVNGDRVVITNSKGEIVTQFRNSRANTQQRIRNGKWVPQ